MAKYKLYRNAVSIVYLSYSLVEQMVHNILRPTQSSVPPIPLPAASAVMTSTSRSFSCPSIVPILVNLIPTSSSNGQRDLSEICRCLYANSRIGEV
jgi:hypothetical protein